jgi:myo-inositol-hexaphosphate 3-phosphohydrolase
MELAVFGTQGFKRQREGLAIVAGRDGRGYLVGSDQIPGGSELRIYPREGRPGQPHAHDPVLRVITTAADSTDGIEVVSSGLGEPIADGLLIMMNSRNRNFLLYRWADVAALLDRPQADGAEPLQRAVTSAEAAQDLERR